MSRDKTKDIRTYYHQNSAITFDLLHAKVHLLSDYTKLFADFRSFVATLFGYLWQISSVVYRIFVRLFVIRSDTFLRFLAKVLLKFSVCKAETASRQCVLQRDVYFLLQDIALLS